VNGGALLLASAALTTAGAQQREPYQGLDAYITAALKQWKVPGLGLAIVRTIARRHKAEVCLDDTPGGGLTARIVFPGSARPA